MERFDALTQLFQRLMGYPAHVVIVELLVIGSVVYLTLRHLRGTRGARVVKGVLLILFPATIVIQLVGAEVFERLNRLYSNVLEVLTIGLIIVFQPELRRALVRLGEFRAVWGGAPRKARVVEQIIESVSYLSRNKIGAIMAIEREEALRGLVEAGVRLDALVDATLLNTIFWPGSALHDMGVVIRGDRIIAASVQFPLAEADAITQELGSRHRAAMGLSQESDALVVIVSEQTGTISVAERGQMTRHLSPDDLRSLLQKAFGKVAMPDELEEREMERDISATQDN